jgi:hypothetical protein
VWNKDSFIGVLASNLGLENTISIYTSFHAKNDPNLPNKKKEK